MIDLHSLKIGDKAIVHTIYGDYSDWEMIDGKHYCPDCYDVEVIDGVYNVKVK